ncbi:MAG: hypothetical protein GXW99_00735 [Clostridiales bacterium]|nr:hypothetical protein [Clostridiales bacterium]
MELQKVDQEPLAETAAAEVPVETAAAGKKKKIILWTAGAVLAALLVASLLFCFLALGRKTVLPHISVMGIPVGGMTRQQAEEALAERGGAYCLEMQIPLTVDGEQASLISLADIGASVDASQSAQAAYNAGHAGNFFTNGWTYFSCLVGKRDVMPALLSDNQMLRDKAYELGEEMSYDATEGSYRIAQEEPDCFYITASRDGRSFNEATLQSSLIDALRDKNFNAIDCVYTAVPAETLDVDALYEEIHGDPVNAAYDKATGDLTDGRPGVEFDAEQAKELVAQAEPGQEVQIPATVKYPEVTKEELSKVLFRDVLGSYSTYVSGSYGRITNVKQAARNISGYILNTGDVFSYNKAVGEQSAATGFYPAPGYDNGKSVMVYGGGICQVSSTLYYACLLSNLEITLRYCHQFAPSYIPFGCDATVSEGDIDYRFRNDTPYPIKVVTYYSNNWLTVEIHGTKTDDTYVRMISNTLSSTGYDVVYEETEDLAPGKTELEQSPYTGYYVETYRNVYSGGGTLLSSTFEDSSDYESRNEIYKIGKKIPDPAPAPTPDAAAAPNP